MDEIKTDQVGGETTEGQSSTEQSKGETQEEPVTAEKAFDLARGLQKGYTQTRQEIAEIRENLQSIAESLNKQTGASQGDDDYVTAGKLREILKEHTEAQIKAKESVQAEANAYIDNTIAQLRAEGIIKNQAEEEELINYAIALGKKDSAIATDLVKVADRWQEIKQAKEEARKEVAKTKERQKEGSVVGTSSKAGSTDEQGINYATLKRMMARGEL